MTQEKILEKIREAFVEVLGDEKIKISPNTSPENLEAWDSFAHIQIILTLEKSLGIKFMSKEVFEWKNAGDIANSISEKLGK
ncbi:MAG: acyl carrier protein [Opitutales bacterium]|nr:acyl carrier protein [Opitutales bacterium]